MSPSQQQKPRRIQRQTEMSAALAEAQAAQDKKVAEAIEGAAISFKANMEEIAAEKAAVDESSSSSHQSKLM